MLEILLGAIFFIATALFALPFFLYRRQAGVPGAQYREAAYGEQVAWLWRSFKYLMPVSPARPSDVTKNVERLKCFRCLMRCVIAQGFDDEIQPWVEDVLSREGEAILSWLTMLWIVQLEYPDDREKQLLLWYLLCCAQRV